jgi:cell division protein FtsZ
MYEHFKVEEKSQNIDAKIKVIGVGGGGGNMINYMVGSGIRDIDMIVANTDAQALSTSAATIKIQLGPNTTRGLGAGMKPEVGKTAAEESFEELKNALRGSDLVFIAAGLGGGTGTGAAAVVAQAAKEIGALTVAVTTKPFSFEGPKREKLATNALSELKQITDSIIIIPNDKLLSIVGKSTGYKESFRIVDKVLSQAVTGISGVILSHGVNDINLDFADLQTVMSHKGLALMGVGESQGEQSAYEAVKSAIESPLFDNMSINGAMGVLVNFTIHPDYPLTSITQAMSIVYEAADTEADIMFGTCSDDKMELDKVKVTIVATGFEKEMANLISHHKPDIQTTTQQVQNPRMSQRVTKVSGGYDITMDEDILNIPTWMRRKMD